MKLNWRLNQTVSTSTVASSATAQRYCCFWLLIAALSFPAGCRKQIEGPDPQSVALQSPQDDLDEALQYINSLDDFDQEQVVDLTVYYLNRWIAPQSADDQWNRSSLIDGLPRRLRDIRFVGTVQEKKFLYVDVDHIHQCSWLRDISNWVNRTAETPHLEISKQFIPDSINSQQREKLLLAVKLFDWTIRNVQLDPLPDPSQENLDHSWNLAYEGTIGPGYTLTPRETILYGHGDAWQRARLFILLARQQRIEVVMLAIQHSSTGQPIPWLPAVMLNDQLYLFDPQLGLPLLTQNGQLATMQQLREDPEILTRLASATEQPYRVQPDDLQRVIGLVDASPFALSQRMLMLQKQLTGGQQMVLTVIPDRVGKQLRDKHGINTTKLWNVPLETLLYADGRERSKQTTDPPVPTESRYRMQEQLFRLDLRSPLTIARQRYVHGQFDSQSAEKGQSETPGAKPLLMSARLSEKEIAAIKTAANLQEALQLQQHPEESASQWQQRLTNAQQEYGAIKQYASYWLGVIQLEQGNYEVAISWLQRTLDDGSDNPFFQGAHYNLGRCYEALGQHSEAKQMYQFADSPQLRGNQLRSQQAIVTKVSEPTNPDPAP